MTYLEGLSSAALTAARARGNTEILELHRKVADWERKIWRHALGHPQEPLSTLELSTPRFGSALELLRRRINYEQTSNAEGQKQSGVPRSTFAAVVLPIRSSAKRHPPRLCFNDPTDILQCA